MTSNILLQATDYSCQISGPGLHSATANHPTYVIVKLTELSGLPCTVQENVTAQLELISEATTLGRRRWSKKPESHVAVVMVSPSQYNVSYRPVSRGQHKLHIQVNDKKINGSPFSITVYPDPTQLGRPARVMTGLNNPYGIVFNRIRDVIVSERSGHRVSVFDVKCLNIRRFGSRGDSRAQMFWPKGIAVDDHGNIYLSSLHKLQKFTSAGELIKCVGREGSKEGEFNDPCGVMLYKNQVYVCDRNNHRIQVFDLDLNFVHSIGSCGNGGGELNEPFDAKFDTAGSMYIADCGNERVQVMDSTGQFIQAFGQEGKGKLHGPSGLFIADKYVYVSDMRRDCIVVYETSGQFVTSFGKYGEKEGEFKYPRSITACAHGFIYICDSCNNRVQIF